jgi:hypothetical protein
MRSRMDEKGGGFEQISRWLSILAYLLTNTYLGIHTLDLVID